MTAPRPKSPHPVPSPIKDEKEETIWDKLGSIRTLNRKKRIKEGELKFHNSNIYFEK